MTYHIVGQQRSSGHISILSVSVLRVNRAIYETVYLNRVQTDTVEVNRAAFTVPPSDKLMDPLSFKSSLRSGVLRRSSSGLRPPGDLSPGEEAANTTGPPLGGGMSMPIRRYFLRLLLIHVCKM